ncbi:16S rRNA (adenine(1518)-N(6)/adenine(1519)-N(6))-dimethyltransferase RsmA [Ruminococcaceae bacterium OttesenSCG-928-A16]|nr:16S rRNA (adenine(1518)-N(6)/adenine(1519)-N(6))-dimethyltransferase RsmA [Ruminococcaceae bacterium OttesenSCG-928-A16]
MENLTDLTTIRTLCEKYGFTLAKGFGQNFIVNAGICPKICEAAGIDKTTNVLEIGPGFGTLTQQLALRAKKVVAIEVDTRLLPVLEETLAEHDNVTIVNQDVLQCDLAALITQEFGGGPVTVCANLPYYITSPILMKLLEDRLPITSITAMVQKEAADRICAAPGTRASGAISYATHYYAAPAIRFTVQPGSFYPPPKVTSAVIQLTLHAMPPLAAHPVREKRLFALVRASFSQRRKTLINAASAGLAMPKQALQAALQTTGLAPLARPEQLTLEQYIALEQALWPEE